MVGLRCLAAILLVVGAAACGKKKDSNKAVAVEASGSLQLRLVVASAADVSGFRLRAAPQTAAFENWSIASGVPETFKIKITRISLKVADAAAVGAASERTVFQDSAGRELRIDGSHIDLSSLFTNFACVNSQGEGVDTGGVACPCGLNAQNVPVEKVDGVCPKPAAGTAVTAPIGVASVAALKYDTVKVDFMSGAKIKGCVSGTFRADHALHTYCTRSELTTFKSPIGSADNTDFEDATGTSAQEMDIHLGNANGDYTNVQTDTFTLEFPISGGITIEKDATQKLTLLIDTNRMLRYNNHARSNETSIPFASRSYFFNSVFSSSVFAFVGEPGSIRGYSWETAACNVQESVPTDHICTVNPFTVAGWLTMIFDRSGNPLLASSIPDDDSTLTVMKGSNSRTGTGLTPGDITAPSAGLWNVVLHLNDDPFNIFNVPASIEVGQSTTDGYFDGQTLADGKYRYGTVKFTRGL
jgi:hypothetical protein